MNYKDIIIKELIKNNLTLGVAESVTGGMICSTLIDVPGASQVIKGGIVAYTNYAKSKLLGVSTDLIERYSEYSATVAREMAMGIRRKLETDISIAVTGQANPPRDNMMENSKTCKVYFCIIVIDKSYDFEMTIPDEGRTNNRITIVSKVIEELFKLIYRHQ